MYYQILLILAENFRNPMTQDKKQKKRVVVSYKNLSPELQEEIKKHGKDALYFPSFEEAEKYLSEKCIDGDLLITMGAGNVVEIGEHLVQK